MPLSPAFPVGELRYILDNSQAGILLATEKYESKAQQVVDGGLENSPVLQKIEKLQSGGDPVSQLAFDSGRQQGGMMLYTSGTTNRPVRCPLSQKPNKS